MILHFPKWMDIRKRTNTSNGGKLLKTFAQEASDIQTAIDDYKKDFFINSYLGHEDDIPTFVYKGWIGNIDISAVILIAPSIDITTDIKKFYRTEDIAYFENGYLFFSQSTISKNFDLDLMTPQIDYEHWLSLENKIVRTTIIEKIHVWNVFDEFAAFTGLRRHTGETNSQLTKRILLENKNPTNSSALGLKNAIVNELSVLAPELSIQDIEISGTTPENLLEYYNEFEQVIDKLAEINKDVLKTKRWDLDSWENIDPKIDYIPHVWDTIIDKYQNGIGFSEDLKVELVDANDKINATIKIYNESEAKAISYIKNRNIKENIKLNLTKYNNELKSEIVDYEIKTAEGILIPPNSPIKVRAVQKIESSVDMYIHQLLPLGYDDENYENNYKDIEIIHNNRLEKQSSYKLIFKPKNEFKPMIIKKCDVVTYSMNKEKIDLLKENMIYKKNQINELTNTFTKIYATQESDFAICQNIKNNKTKEGVLIANVKEPAQLTLNIDNITGEPFFIDYSCEEVLLFDKSNIYNQGFDFSREDFSYTSKRNETNSLVINMRANSFSFDIIQGLFEIDYSINGQAQQTISRNGFYHFETFQYKTPQDISILIKCPVDFIRNPEMESLIIKNFKYSNFNISTQFENGVSYDDHTPIVVKNNLYISLSTKTAISPIINYVYIGQSLRDQTYETDIFTTNEFFDSEIEIDTNCEIMLKKIDGETIENYIPYNEYKAISDEAYIKLDLSSYSDIQDLKTYGGNIDIVGSGRNTEYYLRLKQNNEPINKIFISGTKNNTISLKSLDAALDIQSEIDNDEEYKGAIISNLFDGFACIIMKAIESDEGIVYEERIKYKTITLENFTNTNLEKIIYENLDESITGRFVIDKESNTVFNTNDYSGIFEYSYLTPQNNKINSDFYSKDILLGTKNYTKFFPKDYFLSQNTFAIFLINPLSQDCNIKFCNTLKNVTNWISSKHLKDQWIDISIEKNIDLTTKEYYNKEQKEIQQDFIIEKNIKLKRIYPTVNGELVDLTQYIITTPKDFTLEYTTKQQHQTFLDSPDFFVSQKIVNLWGPYVKLKHSMIDELMYIGEDPWDGETINIHEFEQNYELLKDEGILIFPDIPFQDFNTSEPITELLNMNIGYTIKIPSYITVPLEKIYEKVEYDINAYDCYNEVELSDYDINNPVNINTLATKPSSRITVEINEPGYKFDIQNNKIYFLKEFKTTKQVVKTGYYYIDGFEYYMFANDTQKQQIDSLQNVTFHNVIKEPNLIKFLPKTNNYIKNSAFMLTDTDIIHSQDYTKNTNKHIGVSALNTITACNSFNHWNTFRADISLEKGYNDLAININCHDEIAYAYINITDYLLNQSTISLFLTGNLKAYIGKEQKYNNKSLDNAILFKPILEFSESTIKNIYSVNFKPEKATKYFLVLKGQGIIDDIILSDKDEDVVNTTKHNKTISSLGFSIEESANEGYVSRFYINNDQGNYHNKTEMLQDNTIRNSTMIHWNTTKIKEFSQKLDWQQCSTSNMILEENYIRTLQSNTGYIITPPIFIGNRNIIKDITIKINDALIDGMTGFHVKVKTSNLKQGTYKTVFSYNNNIGIISGSKLDPYILLEIKTQKSSIINNIQVFVDYKSTEQAAPAEIIHNNGYMLSKVFDSHYSGKYAYKNLLINSVNNIEDIDISIRSSKINSFQTIWSPWVKINLQDKNDIVFENSRFFQLKVQIKRTNAHIKIDYIELERI